MKTLHLNADELGLNFDQCLKLANAAAEHLLEKQGGKSGTWRAEPA